MKAATASSVWDKDYPAAKACDADSNSRWGAGKDTRSGWLELELGEAKSVSRIV